MRGWLTTPSGTSRPHTTAQVRSAVEGRVGGRCEAARSAVTGKSLARTSVTIGDAGPQSAPISRWAAARTASRQILHALRDPIEHKLPLVRVPVLVTRGSREPIVPRRGQRRPPGSSRWVSWRLFGIGITRTHALEALVIAGFVRGLSVRDVDAALAEALGPEAALSKATVSRVCAEIKEQFRGLAAAPARRRRPGLPVPGRVAFQVSRQRRGQRIRRRLGRVPVGERGRAARCWSSATARPGCWPRSSAPCRRRCVKGVLFIAPATSWPRCPRTPRPRSKPTTGRSSTCRRRSSLATMRSGSRKSVSTPSPAAGATPTPPRCAACSPTATR
jgi:Transposase, Mutator family